MVLGAEAPATGPNELLPVLGGCLLVQGAYCSDSSMAAVEDDEYVEFCVHDGFVDGGPFDVGDWLELASAWFDVNSVFLVSICGTASF